MYKLDADVALSIRIAIYFPPLSWADLVLGFSSKTTSEAVRRQCFNSTLYIVKGSYKDVKRGRYGEKLNEGVLVEGRSEKKTFEARRQAWTVQREAE
jgi:hypothetical protein